MVVVVLCHNPDHASETEANRTEVDDGASSRNSRMERRRNRPLLAGRWY